MDKAEAMQKKMLESIKEKTGVAPDKIVDQIRKQAFEKHGQKVQFVKDRYGLTHGFANLLAHMSKAEKQEKQEGDLVENQYKGKEGLIPIYESLCKALEKMKGVELAPKKAYVSVRTGKQFAIIQPSTKTRVDLGLKFPKDVEVPLESSGSFNTMVTHRIRLSAPGDVNAEVKAYLKKAYESSLK